VGINRINPNLPGWWKTSRNAINPLFDDYKQYAHYFRYRTTAKLQIPKTAYAAFREGQDDSPLKEFELNVPADAQGVRDTAVEQQVMKMYENYQSLLNDLAAKMGWTDHKLSLGEDVSYGNMVACPSAKWITKRCLPVQDNLNVYVDGPGGSLYLGNRDLT
jgi:hypothetical protein